MGTLYLRTNPYLGSASTTRYIAITTAAAQSFVMDSGFQAIEVFNVGSGTLIYGDSNVAVNSGGLVYVGVGKPFLDLQDGFQVFFRADSVSTTIAITEYAV